VPALPALRNPTRAQAQAAVRQATESRNRSIPQAPFGGERLARQDAYDAELRSDPRQQAYMRRVQRYARVAERRDLEQVGRATAEQVQRGASRRLSRTQAVQIGRYARAQNPPVEGKQHAPDTRLQAAGLNINLTSVRRAITAATSLGADSPENQFVRNTLSDTLNLPKDSVLAVYQIGQAALELAKGDPTKAKQVVNGFADGAVGHLVRGDVDGAIKAIRDHPLYSALELSGTAAALGRGAGIASRVARGDPSLTREPLDVVPGSNLKVERRASPNAIVQAFQRGSDARREGRMGGQVAESTTGGRIPGAVRGEATRGREALINDAVDEFAAQAEGMRRYGRGSTAREGERLTPARRGSAQGGVAGRMLAALDKATAPRRRELGLGTREEQDLVHLAAEGRLTDPAEVPAGTRWTPARAGRGPERERDWLQRVYVEERKEMSPSKRRANRRQVAMLDRALNSAKALGRVDDIMRAADD
jgi:hypothetical protein